MPFPPTKCGGLVSGPGGGHGAVLAAALQAEPGAGHQALESLRAQRGVQLVLSIDTASVTVLERLKWRPFSGVGQATFSLLGVEPEGKK